MTSTSSAYRVITVCTGNICRSPMAELMLQAALEREGLDGLVEVDSAGITGYEAGRPIDPRAARRLAVTQLASEQH
ncbi:MAG: arsenate reductase/protein-tyrosine-phosphatase family protein, partial [Arthrobacter sp.]